MRVLAIATMVLFAAGWIGCALTIPMAAVKFFSILWEKNTPDDEPDIPQFQRIQ